MVKKILATKKNNKVQVSGNKQFGDVCTDLDNQSKIKDEPEHRMHAYVIQDRKFSIKMDFADFLGTIKVTATSGKCQRYLKKISKK